MYQPASVVICNITLHYHNINNNNGVIIFQQGKEVATQMELLPEGSVVFDSVSEEQYEGAVRKPMIRSFTHGRGKEASVSVLLSCVYM